MKSKVYVCCQLSMKSSSFWDTYLLWQNIINHWIPDEQQWLDESKCKFLFGAILLPVKAGTINDVIFTTGMPSPLDNERFYTAVTLFFQDIENLKIDMNRGPKIILAQSLTPIYLVGVSNKNPETHIVAMELDADFVSK